MKKLSGSFRYTQWDPLLIISQIVAMQSVMYVTLGLIVALMQDISESTRSLDHIFRYSEIHVRNLEGQCVISAFVFNAFFGAVALWFIVQRTKLCLDFSCTYHFLHLVICWYYNSHFPTALSWWLLNVACAAITCVTGEFLCLKTELKAIPLIFILWLEYSRPPRITDFFIEENDTYPDLRRYKGILNPVNPPHVRPTARPLR